MESCIPIILCGNKYDCKEVKVQVSNQSAIREGYNKYCGMSVKSCYHWETPFAILSKIFNESIRAAN